jgi:transglutaminase-like putative cysteine protease
VTALRFSRMPHRVFESQGNRYAEFIIDTVKPRELLTISADLEIMECDFRTAKKDQRIQIGSLEPYLKEERFLEKNDEQLLERIKPLIDKDALKTVKNLNLFARNMITYVNNNPQNVGAANALKTERGDCSEYADLFVAACRACNIPARTVFGMVTDYVKNPAHAWAEFYLQKYGWVRLDPTYWPSVNFNQLENRYIQLSVRRNDATLNGGYSFMFTYQGDPIFVVDKRTVRKK